MTDGTSNAIVWVVGSDSGGDQRLHGYNGDTGAVVYAGGGANELMTNTRKWNSGIVARGRIYFAADNKVYAFKVPGGTPTPTPTATPIPTPTPTPTLTPTPSPTPTPTPISQCTVPNFIGVRLNRAQSIWSNAGFTTRVTAVGPGGHNITSQSLPAGSVGSCTTTTITVTAR